MKPGLLILLLAAPGWAQSSAPAPVVEPSDKRVAHFYRPDTPKTEVPYRRIVSLAPVVTETLFLLEQGDRVVGVTRYCDRPVAAKTLPAVGGFVDPQLEVIAALKPDLVIAMPSLGQRRVLDRLRDRGIAVLVAFGDRAPEVNDLIRKLGEVLDAKDEANDLIVEQAAELAKLKATVAGRPRALILVATRPLVVAGPGTFADDALRLVGAVPAIGPGAPAWPTWSWETLVAAKPAVLVVAEGPAAARRLRAQVAERWPKASPRPRVASHDEQIFMRPGPTLHRDVAILARLLTGP